MWAFDLLEIDGEDLRHLPLELRKGELKVLLKRAPFGLALNDYVTRHSSRRPAPWDSRPCVEAPELALPIGPLAALAQGEDPESAAARRGVFEDWSRKRRW